MSGTISLTKPLQAGKVIVGFAPSIASQRFLDTDALTCPKWMGEDLTGRAVCANSFDTTTAGCQLANDRINVENALRPQYSSFVTLNADYITENGYQNRQMLSFANTKDYQGQLQYVGNNITGHFSQGLNGMVRDNFTRAYIHSKDILQLDNETRRQKQALMLAGKRYSMSKNLGEASGF